VLIAPLYLQLDGTLQLKTGAHNVPIERGFNCIAVRTLNDIAIAHPCLFEWAAGYDVACGQVRGIWPRA